VDPGSRSLSSEDRSPADDPDTELSNEEIGPDDPEDCMDVAQDPLFQTCEELVSMEFKCDETTDLLDNDLPPASLGSPLICSMYCM